MTQLHDELMAVVEPWHNFKHGMSKATELKMRPDGELVVTTDVKAFQTRINEASRRLISTFSGDYDLLTSFVEVAANARSIMDLERSRQ